MWMMMDSNKEVHIPEVKLPSDPVMGRKLRPLMPRPITKTPYSSPSCSCFPNPNVLSWNHSLSDHIVEGVKREAAPALVSTRWNPTPEQLQALEEMYRRGIRTPSADQIQQIAAKLSRFGKIQGKNVFYWFQNHKARERQKKRRQLDLISAKNMHSHPTAGLSRRSFEMEHHKKVPIPSKCSTPSEDSASMHGAAIGKDGWSHNKELHRLATAENETCWQLHLDLSSCLPPPPLPPPNIINTSAAASSSSSSSSLNAITTPHKENTKPYASVNLITMLASNNDECECQVKENHTLELFPSPRPRGGEICHTSTVGTKVNNKPTQFIEFLPIKN